MGRWGSLFLAFELPSNFCQFLQDLHWGPRSTITKAIRYVHTGCTAWGCSRSQDTAGVTAPSNGLYIKCFRRALAGSTERSLRSERVESHTQSRSMCVMGKHPRPDALGMQDRMAVYDFQGWRGMASPKLPIVLSLALGGLGHINGGEGAQCRSFISCLSLYKFSKSCFEYSCS